MADGTNVGSIFLDLIVRDTVKEQVKAAAAKSQETARQAFSSVEKAAEKMTNSVTAQTGKVVQKATETAVNASQKATSAMTGTIDRSTALARAKVKELEKAFDAVGTKLDAQWNSGTFDPGKKATSSLLAQQEKLMARIEAARERLRIYAQIAAQKQSAAESAAAQKTAAAEARAATRRKTIHAAMWKNMLAKAGSGAKAMVSTLAGIVKGYNRSGGAARRFGYRLREIASGALLFNGISMAMRNMVSYFTESIASTDEMKQALANLKGAAANAASPIIQVLTPALTALANTAATVLSYVSRLVTTLTGKTSNAAAMAAKSADKAAGAAKKATKSLAGFDEIERLGGDSDNSGSDSDTIAPNYDFQGKSPFLDSVLSAINAGQWEQVGTLFAQKLNNGLASINWPDIHEKARQWTQNIVDTLNGFITELDWGLVGSTIGNGLNTVFISVGTFVRGLKWEALGKGIADMFTSGIRTINWAQLFSDLSAGIVGLLTAAIAFLTNMDWALVGITVADCLFAIDWVGILAKLVEFVASLAAGLIVASVSFIARALYKAGQKIAKLFKEIGENGIQGFLNGMWNLLKDIGSWLWDHLIEPVISGVKEALGIHSPSTVFEDIGINLVLGLLNGLKNTWTQVIGFVENALSWIQTTFSEAFSSLQRAIESIWTNGIVPTIKGAVNVIIGIINSMVSGIVSGINTAIRALNRISVKVPDWEVFGDMAGDRFGFNLTEITAPQIPYLANGGVIKQPTLAMMGEYAGARNNPEIVAPQSLMTETVAAVMEDVIASNIAGFEAVVDVLREILEAILGIEIGDDVVGQAVERYNRKMAVVKGGA